MNDSSRKNMKGNMTTEVRTHTPGPWHIGMKPGPMVYGPQGEQVADLRADLLPKDERLANSRLIVAAPDLLQACKVALAYLEADSDDEQEQEDYIQIRVAIVAAGGGQ